METLLLEIVLILICYYYYCLDSSRKKKTRRVIVADDDNVTCVALKLLFNAEGFEVVIENDGQAVIDRYKKGERFSFVLLDYDMPNRMGTETVRVLRTYVF